MAARTCSMMMLSAVAAVLSPASTLAVNVQAGAHPLNVVILVDESESESPGDVTHEGQAAGAIAQSALKPILMMTDGSLDESYNPGYPLPDWQPAVQRGMNTSAHQGRTRAYQDPRWSRGHDDLCG